MDFYLTFCPPESFSPHCEKAVTFQLWSHAAIRALLKEFREKGWQLRSIRTEAGPLNHDEWCDLLLAIGSIL